MAKPRLSNPQRARRYLQASMESGYTGLPAEHKHAKEQLMREHEHAYPDVRKHALAGTRRDFDLPLTNGEREHQRHLRQQEGLTEHDVREIRDEIRAKANEPSRFAAATDTLAAPTRSAASSTSNALDAATTGKGSLFLQIAGAFVLLSLVYLLVAEKGKTNGIKALQGITSVLTGAVRTFIAPIDPIAKLEQSLGATPVSASSSGTNSSGSGGSGTGTSSAGVGSSSGGSSVGGSGPKTWSLHLAPKPSKIKVKVSTPAQIRAFERATGLHYAHGAG